jgi:purine-binding chemotaxis protein CheW
VPVVDARALLGVEVSSPPARLVTVRLGQRRAALAVDRVEGVRRLEPAAQLPLPPLLDHVAHDTIEVIARLDAELLLLLRASRLLEVAG